MVTPASNNEEETVANNFNVEESETRAASGKRENAGRKGDINKAKEIAPSVASNKQKFIIQVASLKDKTNANKMNKKIASLGFTSQVIKIDS